MKQNFGLLTAAIGRLGGVPLLLSADDCLDERGPDEKAVVLFAAYLSVRLLEVSEEERAAHAIQRAWREREARKPGLPPSKRSEISYHTLELFQSKNFHQNSQSNSTSTNTPKNLV